MYALNMADKVKIKGIAPEFVVNDVVQTAEYYRDVLGFEINGYFLDPPVFAIIERSGIRIHLGKSDAGTYKTNYEFRKITSDAYIWVDDTTRLFEELIVRKADIVEAPTMRVYGMREMKVRDCNGYLLTFGDG
jgi:uncharacterized glyoxalase superfamily protein PhnB